jgi:hypothetical protein
MVNTRYHDDPLRMSGCCGPSGIDGVNTLCTNGHEVATESSDCWTGPHYVELEPYKCIIVEMPGAAEPGAGPDRGGKKGSQRSSSPRRRDR